MSFYPNEEKLLQLISKGEMPSLAELQTYECRNLCPTICLARIPKEANEGRILHLGRVLCGSVIDLDSLLRSLPSSRAEPGPQGQGCPCPWA